ncbi:MAG: malectin domain-containing carbohydrate-binding protein [Oscillatoria sp. PMC 1068.18]|nr:malectin domain-containing carbohydrate-binding protein [Oscillatoria sp. PMC 1076.18]MEC4987379.1 malectin domain-containing carbohydrate-binding protein [Oscillatoria sp. PMC 1068.18]
METTTNSFSTNSQSLESNSGIFSVDEDLAIAVSGLSHYSALGGNTPEIDETEISRFTLASHDFSENAGYLTNSEDSSFVGDISGDSLLGQPQSLIIIDPSVTNYQQLTEGISSAAEVILLNDSTDGIAQISEILSDRREITSLHLVSHGDIASLELGSTELSSENLEQYSESLQTWASAFTAEADILLYGCNVAAGETGSTFIQELANLTSADVAASDDLTGVGGDWNLEVTTANIETGIVFDAEAIANYEGTLHTTVALINAGGSNYTDTTNHNWTADQNFTGGKTYSNNSAISGTDNDALFQSERYGKDFSYDFAVANGDYQVKLNFAEIYWDTVGKRVFDVTVENQIAIDNLDIYAEVGKNVALTKTVTTTVTDGNLDIDFSTVANNAKVSSIEIIPLEGHQPPEPDTTAPTASLNATNLNTTSGSTNDYTFTVQYTDNVAIDVSTIDSSDLKVTGPNNFNQLATLESININSNGTPRTATYSIAAPGGDWDAADAGSYTISLEKSQVNDTSGNYASNAVLGSFQASVTDTPPPQTPITLINAGGGSYTDGNSDVWNADQYFSGGKIYSTGSAISGTDDDTLFQTERSGKNFAYDFAVADGDYQVELNFAEIYWGATGQRIFDVTIENNLVLDEFDIYAEAGGKNVALTKTFNIGVVDGNLDIDFSTTKDNAKISSIKLTPLGEIDNYTPTTSGINDITVEKDAPNSIVDLFAAFDDVEDADEALTYTITSNTNPGLFDSTSIDGTTGELTLDYNANATGSGALTVRATDTEGLYKETTFSVTVNEEPPEPSEGIRINAGGGAYTDGLGQQWQADNYFLNGKTYSTGSAIDGTTDDSIYQTERSGKTFGYAVPVINGAYDVNLHLAETYWDTSNKRIFDVIVEGQLLYDEFDLWTEAGGKNKALIETIEGIEVKDGILNIDFTTTTDNAKISGLEITPSEPPGHYLHVVIDAPKWVVDYDGNGSEVVALKGNESHTHEFGEELTEWVWKDQNDNILGAQEDITAPIAVGEHNISLTIGDSKSPKEYLTDSVALNVYTPDAVGGGFARYYEAGGQSLANLISNLPAEPNWVEVLPEIKLEQSSSGTIGGSPFSSDTVMTIDGEFTVSADGLYDFNLIGGSASQFYIDADSDGDLDFTNPNDVYLSAGTYELQSRFAIAQYSNLPIEVQVAPDGGTFETIELFHDHTQLDPFINDAPEEVSPFGSSVTLEGFFPADSVVVNWGDTVINNVQLEQGSVTFNAPTGTLGTTVPVTVEMGNGESNTVFMTYEGIVEPDFEINAIAGTGDDWSTYNKPTQADWGPDGKLYVGGSYGTIQIYSFDDNYNVIGESTINTIQGLSNPSILGIAFNPYDQEPKIYVAHSQLFANNGGNGINPGDYSPYSGQISVLSGPGFSNFTPLVTGLPVSNHDHGINGLAFDDNGDLLITVGGNTNAGVPGDLMGGLPESPLSGAIVKANITNPNFNGNIQYELSPGETAPSGFDPTNQVYGDIVDVVDGVDVEVFAPGFRNAFDIVWTTSGQLYGTDNGPNTGYGNESTGANTQSGDPSYKDEVNYIVENGYYGHPNRNRGRYDDRQNVYYSGGDLAISGVHNAPIASVNSSTNGITEYRATTFGGQLRGNLLAQKWNGTVYGFKLSADGTQVETSDLYEENTDGFPSSLDIVTGPGGTLIGVDYGAKNLTISKPIDPAAVGVTAYDIFPWRAPAAGGHSFTIGGANFGTLSDTTVTIGGQQAILTKVSDNRIQGILPEFFSSSNQLLDIVVNSAGDTSVIPDGFKVLTGTGAVVDPEPTPSDDTGSEALVVINPGGNIIQSSTFSSGSFKITNNSTNAQKIDRVLIDLSSGILPDMVFDPTGQAGDTWKKVFTVDNNGGTGTITHNYLNAHDGGFDALEINFTDFDPGETMTFSIDVDPTSAQGTPPPGPGESASVSGLELAGAEVTVAFSDGTSYTGETYRMANSSVGSQTTVQYGIASAPQIEALGISAETATVANASQTIRISGTTGASVRLLVVEAALFEQSGGGFDIDPYEANNALKVTEKTNTVGANGYVDIPVTLTKSDPEGGLNYVVAVFENPDGTTSLLSSKLVLELV